MSLGQWQVLAKTGLYLLQGNEFEMLLGAYLPISAATSPTVQFHLQVSDMLGFSVL